MKTAWLLAAGLTALSGAMAQEKSKRGLVFISNTDTPVDNRLFAPPQSGLSWYYNYGPKPAPLYEVISQDTFEFVPNMWGVDNDNPDDDSFMKSIQVQIKNGRRIKNVLSFNDPDALWNLGGSNIDPRKAARAWVANMVPLREMGVRVSLPSLLTDHDPDVWVPQFLANCSEILKKECDFDFLGLHIYGNMDFVTARVEKFANAHPGKPIWVLEYALHNEAAAETQKFFNASLNFFDSNPIIERYAYFGSFRADTSQVGPSVAMLDSAGKLTDIGKWYLSKGASAGSSTGGTGSSGSNTSAAAKGFSIQMFATVLFGLVALVMVSR